jgi:hypothetical protein
MKITEVGNNFGATFSTFNVIFNFDNMVWATFWVIFDIFTNSSGHPVRRHSSNGKKNHGREEAGFIS